MDTRAVVTRYYELANAGNWDEWCDLFAEDQVMDEQLAGHVEGRETLRKMMAGFPGMYASFQNSPKEIIVEKERAAVVSHISAVTPDGNRIEADVMNFYRVSGGVIVYMANFHDTQPFRAALGS
ncbi:nuclear transport factor 2 family protein [Actinoplanes sp. NEAU-A12]|uniref:Nuclear transport factor 2 family protein n=1 Tax=Actinoplanes sandaracinus TaxID=3045177 RepID=A0ABT6WL27_9ACTN|nr:nuclear transport factor 2 family protein [Actinoplanes sandaracinus]MDI6100440.1 nuclear transport factor 2 family protein [Actinoplanes sandaracinus]